MKYVLVSYGKGSEVPRAEVDVSQVGLERLSTLFQIQEPEFVDVYPVNPVQAAQLGGWIDSALDTDSYDYYLEVGREPGT